MLPYIKSYKAYTDLSSYQFCAMYLTDDETVTFVNTKGAEMVGILLNKPSAAGEAAEVCMFGPCLVKAGGAITRLQQITPTTAGVLIIPDTAGQQVVGRALESMDSGDIKMAFVNMAGAEAYAAES